MVSPSVRSPQRRLRAVIAHDAAAARAWLVRSLVRDGAVEVVGTASDGVAARDQVVALRPDVLVLDLGVRRVSALDLILAVMRHAPMPIVALSSSGRRGADDARAAGARAVVSWSDDGDEVAARLVRAVRAVAPPVGAELPRTSGRPSRIEPGSLVAIGSSTGGPEALRSVLGRLPDRLAPIVVVQHIVPAFLEPLVRRLARETGRDVRVAEHGEVLAPTSVRFAPADAHLVVERRGAALRAAIVEGPRVRHQRPAADVLFASVARAAGDRGVGVVLTGMGDDGADGLAEMHRAGAWTVAEDESTAAVYGMPRACIERGIVERPVPLSRVPQAIVDGLRRRAG